jgi:shikimate 5-dehydrogenase
MDAGKAGGRGGTLAGVVPDTGTAASRAQIVAFLGVTTRASSITRIFPAWARACDLRLELRCIDLPLASPAGSYRALAEQLLEDRSVLGMVITSRTC